MGYLGGLFLYAVVAGAGLIGAFWAMGEWPTQAWQVCAAGEAAWGLLPVFCSLLAAQDETDRANTRTAEVNRLMEKLDEQEAAA